MKDNNYMQNILDDLNRIDEKKKKIDAVRPLPRELVHNLDEYLAMNFTYESNAIEGNTLSLSETAMIIEKGITVGGKTLREHLEAINHAQAIDFIMQLARQKKDNLALDDILAIHKLILQKIDEVNVKVPFLMVDFMSWLHGAHDHPIIVAACAHYKLVTIHPFIDGNGRTARLLMNLLLLQQGYPLAIIKKEQRAAYINAIELARHTQDFSAFYKVIVQAVEHSLDIYLESIEQSDLS